MRHNQANRSKAKSKLAALCLSALCLIAVSLIAVATAEATAPTVTINTAVRAYTTAEVSGEVHPEGKATAWHFEYIAEAAYQENLAHSEPGFKGALEGPSGSVAENQKVKGELTGLSASTKYHLRLLAHNSDGEAEAVAAVFETKAPAKPLIDATSFASVTTTEATLSATINPRGAATTFRFQYVTQEAFQVTGFTGASETAPAPLEGVASPDLVGAAVVTELAPGTQYRFRALAENEKGAVVGAQQLLLRTYRASSNEPDICPNAGRRTELHSTLLPDCRAYEMVSPPDKHGGDVIAYSGLTRAAVDGSAVQFSSLSAFGDAAGTGVATDYMALRSQSEEPGSNGWSTHALTPTQEALVVNAVIDQPHYEGDFSSNLERGVFFAFSPLTEDPGVAQVPNLYLRDDLRSPGAGDYRLLSSCPLCEEPGGEPLPPPIAQEERPYYGGASADFTHVAFEMSASLTADAPAEPANCAGRAFFGIYCLSRAYESVAGNVRLVGLVPPGAETTCGGETGPACEPAPASIVGHGLGANGGGALTTPIHVISDNGRRLFFTVPTDNSGNVTDGRQITGRLYMRLDGAETVQLDVPNAGVSSAYSPARYWGASADGKRVFFSTTQSLTEAPGAGLYMYDAEAPAGERLTWLDTDANGFQDVIGISEDGSYVYYQDGSGGQNVYMWHEGHLALVGKLAFDESTELSLAGPYNLNPSQARVSADGHLLFTSHSGTVSPLGYNQGACVTGAGGKGCRELYLYSPATESLNCVSCNPSGAAATAGATGPVRENAGGSTSTPHRNRTLSADGTRVFFSTPESLLPADTNGVSDAYEWEAPGAGSCAESSSAYMPQDEGCIYLLSSGTSSAPSWFLEASPDGRDVFIVTRQPLVGWDKDVSYDLYDARVQGGFPEPSAETAPCNGNDPCRGAAPPTPPPPGTGTPGFQGPEDETPVHHCPKGTRKVKTRGKTRCVKPHKHKSKKHRGHKRANTNRRAGR